MNSFHKPLYFTNDTSEIFLCQNNSDYTVFHNSLRGFYNYLKKKSKDAEIEIKVFFILLKVISDI